MKYSILISLVICSVECFSLSTNEKLEKVLDVYDLKPFDCKTQSQDVDKNLFALGKELFSSTLLGGEGDTSCETCHLESKAFTDGLPISVGVGGGDEKGESRLYSRGIMVPRNAFTLVGRGAEEYSAYFWDGRIQIEDKNIVSPVGNRLDTRLQTILSVAAIQPILARDEFLGKVEFFSDNPHVDLVNNQFYSERFESASKLLNQKITKSRDPAAIKIRELVSEAGYTSNDINLSLIGNALASFIAQDISCYESPWTLYLSGNENAITNQEKEGALLFFGKARCAACHSGPLFSDFQYHSLGVPQGAFGIGPLGSDEGRATSTNRQEDRYKFRTPPLLLVSKTSPYGHNGTFATLHDVVLFHLNPIPFLSSYNWKSETEFYQFGKILAARDELLAYQDILNSEELEYLIMFLNTL